MLRNFGRFSTYHPTNGHVHSAFDSRFLIYGSTYTTVITFLSFEAMVRQQRRSLFVGNSGNNGAGGRFLVRRAGLAALFVLLAAAFVTFNVWFAGKLPGSSRHKYMDQSAPLLMKPSKPFSTENARTERGATNYDEKVDNAPISLPQELIDRSSVAKNGNFKNEETLGAAIIREKKQTEPESHEQNIHLVFSTSCSFKQDWQSYAFFFQVMSSGQQGDVTRIVSGCEPEQQEELQRIHKEQIQIMSDRFHIHFTPEYGGKDNKSWQSTKYWNKPFGMRHWLEHAMGFPGQTVHDDDIVILVDPDMLLLEPFVNDFSTEPMDLWTTHFRKNNETLIHRVTHGQPIAQDYAFGDSWFTAAASNLSHVVGPDSPVHSISKFDRKTFYPAGPPYILTFRDMYQVTLRWCEFLPRLFDIYPKFMAEMYGYCLAAAHLGLKHQLGKGFMVSNVDMGRQGEGWFFLNSDRIRDPKDICAHPEQPLPYVPHLLHFCQRYSIGDSFISKYKTHHGILSCDLPLFEVPPSDAAATLEFSHFGDGSVTKYDESTRYLQHRNAFMTCALMKSLNQAAIYFKRHHCEQSLANYNTTWNFFRDESDKKAKRGK